MGAEAGKIPAFSSIMIAEQAHDPAGREGWSVNFARLRLEDAIPERGE
jgi:hypothetical protein